MSSDNKLVKKDEAIDIVSPSAATEFAGQLKDLIVNNKLCTPLKGKNYVNVEGWQIAGAFLGIEPSVEKVENISDGNTIRYRAEVSLTDTKTGRKCGYGVAICTNKEPGKEKFAEYAVASMAQTRAVGKAFRVKLGWLLKLAGYESTPSEEMDAVVEAERVPNKKQPPRNKPWQKYSNNKPTQKQIDWIKDLLKQGGATEEATEAYLKKITTFDAASKAIDALKKALEDKKSEETVPMPSDEELENIDFAPMEESA